MKTNTRGFTLIELLVVIAIIGILAAISMSFLNDARVKGADGARKSQIQEVFKALELYHTDHGEYPLYGTNSDDGGTLDGIEPAFYGAGTYLKKLPLESNSHYFYCVSADRRTMFLAVDTSDDKGGSAYCRITRGPGSSYGCPAVEALAVQTCSDRF